MPGPVHQETLEAPFPLETDAKTGANQLGLLRKLTKLLVIAVLALGFFLFYKFFYPSGLNDVSQDFIDDGQNVKANDQPVVLPRSKPFSEYEKVFTARDMFDMPYLNDNNAPKPKEEEDVAVVKGTLEQFKLVGVILDQHPQILLRHQVTNNVIFLSPGQEIEGAVLKEVNKDGVIFLNQGKKIQLQIEEDQTANKGTPETTGTGDGATTHAPFEFK